MNRIVKLAVALLLVSTFSWAQNTTNTAKKWRLNEQGKLQLSLNEGATWEMSEDNVEARLSAFQFLNADNGWAVGQNATILHWDGEKWSEVLIFSSANLLSVFLQDDKNGWAAGSGGTILHWDGTSWNAENSPTTETLVNIKSLSTGALQITTLNGTTFERVNAQWHTQNAPVAPTLSASLGNPE
ncbi:WD40/YVTN/BNR-like repeat-containing protein [Runella sp.]|uniref:WD40/YVTN/BNR-like repeat-containing protein n=1 Tax=Runella sp. TaxID=1960881 RepID=UPI003D0B1891